MIETLLFRPIVLLGVWVVLLQILSGLLLLAQDAPAAPQPPEATAAEATAAEGAAGSGSETSDQAYQLAREHFEIGNAHYGAGRYKEALESFVAGYRLVPRPSFQLNMGQAYRKLGDLPRAKEAYISYLRSLTPTDPMRVQIAAIVLDIEVELGERRQHPTAAPVVALKEVPLVDPFARNAIDGEGSTAVGRTKVWMGLGLGGLGAALVGTGLALELMAQSEARALTDLDRTGGAFDLEREDRGLRYQKTGLVVLAAGGATVAAGAVLLWLGVREKQGSGGAFAWGAVPTRHGVVMTVDVR
jgi:tetratricopeptide (TPR) repeat protein